MDPQVSHHVLPLSVKEMLPLRPGAAVRAHITADGADGTVLVDDERALAAGEGILGAPADAGGEEALVPVENVRVRRSPGADPQPVVLPAVGEMALVEGRGDVRIFGIRPRVGFIGRFVVARKEGEAVVHIADPGRGVQRAVLLEEVHIGRIPAQGIGHGHLKRARWQDMGGWRSGGSALLPRVLRHKDNLVVTVQQRVGIPAREGAFIRVVQTAETAVGRASLIQVCETDHGALVHLHGNLGPGPVVPERRKVAGGNARQGGGLRTGHHHRVHGPVRHTGGPRPARPPRDTAHHKSAHHAVLTRTHHCCALHGLTGTRGTCEIAIYPRKHQNPKKVPT